MLVCKIFLFIIPSEIVAIRVKWWFYNGVTNGTNKKISLLLALCCLLIFCAEISRKHKKCFHLILYKPIQLVSYDHCWLYCNTQNFQWASIKWICLCSKHWTGVNASIFLCETKLFLYNQSVKQSQLRS